MAGAIGAFSLLQPLRHEPKNEIEAWTRGYLTEGTYVKVDVLTIIGTTPKIPLKNIYHWVIDSNSTTIVAVVSSLVPGPFGAPASVVRDLKFFTEEEFYIFPFTIRIPEAQAYFEALNSNNKNGTEWIVVKDEKGWDTRRFTFKKTINGTTRMTETWVLDADTHLARQIKITLNKTTDVKRIITIKESSTGVKGVDELSLLASSAGYLSLIVGPAAIVGILYKRKGHPVQSEKERLESEEYKEDYIKKYERERRRRYEE